MTYRSNRRHFAQLATLVVGGVVAPPMGAQEVETAIALGASDLKAAQEIIPSFCGTFEFECDPS